MSWQYVRWMTERQKQWRALGPRDPHGDGSRIGWIAAEAPDRIIPYPALFVPKPSMEEVYTAYQQHPKRRKRK